MVAIGRSALAVGLVGVALSTEARAEPSDRLSLRGDLGVGSMASSLQRDTLSYGFAVQTALRAGVRLTGPVVAQVSAARWDFPRANGGAGRATQFAAGVRVEPRIPALRELAGIDVLPWIDGNVGYAMTGPFERVQWDLGLGIEVLPLPWLGVGPAFRYAEMAAGPDDQPVDPKFWSVGVAITWRAPFVP